MPTPTAAETLRLAATIADRFERGGEAISPETALERARSAQEQTRELEGLTEFGQQQQQQQLNK